MMYFKINAFQKRFGEKRNNKYSYILKAFSNVCTKTHFFLFHVKKREFDTRGKKCLKKEGNFKPLGKS